MENNEQISFFDSFDQAQTETPQTSNNIDDLVNIDAQVEPASLTEAEAKEKINALRKEIEHHTYLYYAQDKPEISDGAYDSLMRGLRKLEAAFPQFNDENSPTMRVGGYIDQQFSAVKHQIRMYSLDNAMDLHELDE